MVEKPDHEIRNWGIFILYWLAIAASIVWGDLSHGVITLKGMLK